MTRTQSSDREPRYRLTLKAVVERIQGQIDAAHQFRTDGFVELPVLLVERLLLEVPLRCPTRNCAVETFWPREMPT